MILKTDNRFSQIFLTQFESLIGISINMIYSDRCSLFLDTNEVFLNETVLELYSTESQIFNLKIKVFYEYDKVVGDEVNTFKLSFFENEKLISSSFPIPVRIHQQKSFRISAIKIYGQNRTRIWNKDMIDYYFSEEKETNIPSAISDVLFTNEVIVFENKEGIQLVFWVNRFKTHLFKTRNVEKKFENDFYQKEELGISISDLLDSESNSNSMLELTSNEKRYKLNYHFK